MEALDPVFLSQPRFMTMALLNKHQESEFNFLKTSTDTTAGNLSIQLQRLKSAGYVEIRKQFKGNYPVTMVSITPSGKIAFHEFVENINSFAAL